MRTNVCLILLGLMLALVVGCQNNATMSKDDQSNFKPKPLPAAEMAQKMSAVQEKVKEYQKLHPVTGVPGAATSPVAGAQ
jgi:hypothetical protein